MTRLRINRSPVHTALWIDAAFELVAGAAILGFSAPLARWLDVERSLLFIVTGIFLAAAVAVGLIALKPLPSRPLVSGLGALNLIGGLAIWCVLALTWTSIAAEGRWVGAALADSFIAVGILEFLALRRWQTVAESTD